MTSCRRRRGFTLIEVVIAFAILGGMMALILMVVRESSYPITDTTQRSHQTTTAQARVNELVLALQGSANVKAGDYAASTFTEDTTDYHSGTEDWRIGPAIEFQRVTGYDPSNDPPEALESASVFAFVDDGTFNDSAATKKMKLVRKDGATGHELTILKNIPKLQTGAIAAGSPPTPKGPHFRIKTPSEVEIKFEVWREVSFETATNKRIYTKVEFTRTLSLRNMNQ